MATFHQKFESVSQNNNIVQDNRSVTMGDENVVGNVLGDNVTINAEHIGHVTGLEDTEKKELERLVTELQAELAKVSPEQKEQAKEVQELTDGLLEQAAAEKPNSAMLKVTGQGLLEAAKAVAGVMPTVAKIVPQVVKLLVH